MTRTPLLLAAVLVTVALLPAGAAEEPAGARATVTTETPLDGVIVPAKLKIAAASAESAQRVIPNVLTPGTNRRCSVRLPQTPAGR